MIISIDKKVMNEIIKTVSKKEALHSKKNLLGIFSDKVTDNIENLCLKLLFYTIAVGENCKSIKEYS